MTSSKTVQNMKQHIRQMQSGDVRDENESNCKGQGDEILTTFEKAESSEIEN